MTQFFIWTGKLVANLFIILMILLGSLWLIDLIPLSHQDIQQLHQENLEQIELSGFAPINEKPIFYFAVRISKKQESSFFWPSLVWNGKNNLFHHTLSSYLKGDFGISQVDSAAVEKKVFTAMIWTLSLQIPALLIIIMLAYFIALKWVQTKNSKNKKFISALLIILHSMPGFWMAGLLIYFFSIYLNWFPASFIQVADLNPVKIWLQYPVYFILPLMSLVLPGIAMVTILLRSGFEWSTSRPFWWRALSTGISLKSGLSAEAKPHALLGLTGWMSGILPAMISGSVLIENIFLIPGLGRLVLTSIGQRDWSVVLFVIMTTSILSIASILLSNRFHEYWDPREKPLV